MAEQALMLAGEARRASLVIVIWQLREKLTLDRLDKLLSNDDFGEELAAITLAEILASRPEGAGLAIRRGESVEDAVMRVFRTRPAVSLSSGFFVRHMGLARWTAQALLADLADRGYLDRSGKTSSATRYRLATCSDLQPAVRAP
jgi:hypothetical protein